MQYELKINGDATADYSPIISLLKNILGEDADIKLKFVDDIPVISSNKRRAVICNYQPENS